MTDEAQKLIESEDEDQIVTKKRKVSKTTPKKTPKKVSKESTPKKVSKESKKIEKKKKTVNFKGDVKAAKKIGQSEQVGCVVLFGIGWCHVPCSCKPRR